MVQDEEEFPANTEVFKGKSDEVLRHWARNSDEKRLNQWFPKEALIQSLSRVIFDRGFDPCFPKLFEFPFHIKKIIHGFHIQQL